MPLRIKLDKDWYITSDKEQYKLAKKEGKQLNAKYFFASLDMLLREYVGMQLRLGNATDMKMYLDHEKKLLRQLNIALKPIHIKVSTD